MMLLVESVVRIFRLSRLKLKAFLLVLNMYLVAKEGILDA